MLLISLSRIGFFHWETWDGLLRSARSGKKNILDAVSNCPKTTGLGSMIIFVGDISGAKFSAELLSLEHSCFVNALVPSLRNY